MSLFDTCSRDEPAPRMILVPPLALACDCWCLSTQWTVLGSCFRAAPYWQLSCGRIAVLPWGPVPLSVNEGLELLALILKNILETSMISMLHRIMKYEATDKSPRTLPHCPHHLGRAHCTLTYPHALRAPPAHLGLSS